MFGRPLILLLLGCLGLGPAAPAQTVYAGLGRLHPVGARETATYAWEIGYLQPLTDTWGTSIAWLNEGHLEDHHRDGAALQVWRRHRMERNDLVLAGGLGPYRTFDTVPAGPPRGYRNQHGLGLLWSLRAEYPLAGSRLVAYLDLNRVTGVPAPRTQSALVGLALRLDPVRRDPVRRDPVRRDPVRLDAAPEETVNQLAFLAGCTILNSLQSETSGLPEAYALEYRRRVTGHLDLALAYTDEGGLDSARRDGLVASAWLVTRPGRWQLAAGIGPYVYRRFPNPDGAHPGEATQVRTCLRYSMEAGLHLSGHWGARFQWHRTVTRDHRDTDALLAGLAYGW